MNLSTHSDLILRRVHPLGAPVSKHGRESEPSAMLRDVIQSAGADWITPQDEGQARKRGPIFRAGVYGSPRSRGRHLRVWSLPVGEANAAEDAEARSQEAGRVFVILVEQIVDAGEGGDVLVDDVVRRDV